MTNSFGRFCFAKQHHATSRFKPIWIGKVAKSWLVLGWIVMLLLPGSVSSFERRQPQDQTEPSYLSFPLPYSIPGIGSGIMVTGLIGNFMESHFDLYALGISGDAGGHIIGLQDIHLISETLIVGLYYQDLNKALVNQYDKRGMDTTKDEYSQIELSKVLGVEGEILLSLFDRRFEIFAGSYQQSVAITHIRDSEGEILQEFDDPYESEGKSTQYGARFDYTDDFQDPRIGIRLQVTIQPNPPDDADIDPDFQVLNKSVSIYIPIGEDSTLAFNAFSSDAIVLAEGDTNPEQIRSDLGLECAPADMECEQAAQALVDTFVAQRQYGTASSLGGQYRFRGYPQSRFQGAHSLYYAAEFRWNMSTKITPFNFGIWKDISTGIQLAFFHEVGAAADLVEDLNNGLRTSSGIGIRMISASGFVYRFDLAGSDEGTATTVFFNYPW